MNQKQEQVYYEKSAANRRRACRFSMKPAESVHTTARGPGDKMPWFKKAGILWNTYGKKAGFKRYLFNRYYLVKLPDGNYVAAFLDDGVYLRYCLTGSVQLPVGYIEFMDSGEKKLLAPYIEEYKLHEEKILNMFCEERYEKYKILNYIVLIAVWALVLTVYFLLLMLVERVFGHKVDT